MNNVKDTYLKILIKHFSKFIPIDEKDKEMFSSLFKHKFFEKKQYFLTEGDTEEYLGFLLKGTTRSYFIDDNGNEYNFCFSLEGEWIGDFESFFYKIPSWLNIEFLEDSDILMFDNAAFNKLTTENRKYEKYFRILFQDTFINYAKRIKLGLHAPAKEKYINFRKMNPKIDARIPQKHIASYLGMTAEFLSKIKKELSDK
jgi:CRP-like cAMP-binding protein